MTFCGTVSIGPSAVGSACIFDQGVERLGHVVAELQGDGGVDRAVLDQGEDLVVAAELDDAGQVLAGRLEGADEHRAHPRRWPRRPR